MFITMKIVVCSRSQMNMTFQILCCFYCVFVAISVTALGVLMIDLSINTYSDYHGVCVRILSVLE